jgi:hypothetical protein
MPICARAIQQPDGSYLLALDPAETNPATCPYVVSTGTESLLGSLADLSPENALVISIAAAGVWAIAWGFRLLAHTLFSDWEIKNENV